MTHIDLLLENWKKNRLTPQERLQLFQLLDQQEGQAHFDQLWQKNWQRSGEEVPRADSVTERLQEIQAEIRGQIRGDRRKLRASRFRWVAALAAGVAVLLLTVWWMFQQRERAAGWESGYAEARILEARVDRGGRVQKIFLADGSLVWLNVDSRLEYPATFSDTLRQVWITGEAYFEVEEDSTRPFVVSLGELQTRVLGTTFYVSAYPDAPAAVTLESGKVRVFGSLGQQVLLQPRDQLRVEGPDQWLVRPLDLSQLGTWREGKLAFEGVPLAELEPRLERWYRVQIDIESDRARDCWIYGKPTDQSIWDLLESFRTIRGITYEVDEAGVIRIGGGDCTPNP